MPRRLRGWAPAKLNLVLEVLARRADGYHEIDTILHTLELAGTVDLDLEAEEPRITITGPFAEGVPADETNLAWRAAVELAQRVGQNTTSLAITLDKQVPAAGGLGGGASDAATTLRLLQRAWEAPEETVVASAAAIGSDEAFFLVGGAARAQGRGERVTRMTPLHRHGVVLFVPPGSIARKTARMFEALSKLPFDSGSISQRYAQSLPEPMEGLSIYNSFERVAFDLFPGLARLWQQLEERLSQPVHLAGAGPTLFWIGDVFDVPRIAMAADELNCTAIPTATAASLWRL